MPWKFLHKEVEQPIGEPPATWSIAHLLRSNSDIDSAEQNITAHKHLPTWEGEHTVEETGDSRKRSVASQSSTTRDSLATNTQSTPPKHVKRTSKRRKVSWEEPIAATVIATPFT